MIELPYGEKTMTIR